MFLKCLKRFFFLELLFQDFNLQGFQHYDFITWGYGLDASMLESRGNLWGQFKMGRRIPRVIRE